MQQLSLYWQRISLGLILLAATIVYASVISFDFVNLDDPLLVYENPFVTSFSLSHVAHSFVTYDPELYIPLTFVSYQLEAGVLGLHAWHFHAINLLLHLGCIALLFLVLRRLFDARIALIAAALFALHPLNTETVAWVSARKDLLSAFFSLAALHAFLALRQSHNRKWYFISVLLFTLALLSKATAIILPAVFLLIDSWRRRPIDTKTVASYVPFFLLSAACGVIALIGKHKALASAALSPFRWVLLSARATVVTVAHIIWPVGLSPFYPVSSDISILHAAYFLPVLAIIAILVCLVVWRMRSLGIALCVFVLTLFSSFFTFAKDDHLYLTSDRYMYLPSIIFFILIAIGIFRLMRLRKYAALSYAIITILIIICAATSMHQSTIWRSAVALNQSILARSPDEYRSVNNLGNALETEGKTDEALMLYKRAIAINPQFEHAYLNAGSLLANRQNYPAAIDMFAAGLRSRPSSIALRENMALAQERAGLPDAAIQTYESILALDPRDVLALQELAPLYGKKKQFEKALMLYKRLMEIDPAFKARVAEEIKQSGMGK